MWGGGAGRGEGGRAQERTVLLAVRCSGVRPLNVACSHVPHRLALLLWQFQTHTRTKITKNYKQTHKHTNTHAHTHTDTICICGLKCLVAYAIWTVTFLLTAFTFYVFVRAGFFVFLFLFGFCFRLLFALATVASRSPSLCGPPLRCRRAFIAGSWLKGNFRWPFERAQSANFPHWALSTLEFHI